MIAFAVENPVEQASLEKEPFHRWIFQDGTTATTFYRTAAGYLLRFAGVADFLVTPDGHHVRCRPVPDASDQTIRHLYLNQVLPLAFSRQGRLVFHASAVEIAGHGVAFAGESGRGKSTIAASFAMNGCPVMTDDGLVVEESETGYSIHPSHPSIRLWQDSQEALLLPVDGGLPRLPYTSKVRFMAEGTIAFCGEMRPLKRLYFLGDGESREVLTRRLSASDALVELVRHSFLLDIEACDLVASHFDQLSRLVRRPILYRLDYPRRFEYLAEVRNAIVRDCENQ